ncbi:unnamed protein product, partial [Timema podura]|nr:unnamed protein product [Timema podura]
MRATLARLAAWGALSSSMRLPSNNTELASLSLWRNCQLPLVS